MNMERILSNSMDELRASPPRAVLPGATGWLFEDMFLPNALLTDVKQHAAPPTSVAPTLIS